MSRSKHFPVIQMPWNLLLHDLSLNSGLPSMTVMALHVTSNGKYRLPFDLPLLSTQFPTQFTFSSDSLVRSQFQREFFSLSSPTHAAKKLPYFTSSAKRSQVRVGPIYCNCHTLLKIKLYNSCKTLVYYDCTPYLVD